MPHNLARFSLEDMAVLGSTLRTLGSHGTCLEDVAARMTHHLYEALQDDEGAPACALLRFFTTLEYGALPAELQQSLQQTLREVSPHLKCLTLLATRGAQAAWNDRRTSVGHQAIPLLSPEMVSQSPMISHLIHQLGIDVEQVVAPTPRLLLDEEQKVYNVLFVPQAEGSPHIPAQDFVREQKIQSVLGFGGMLATGNMYAVLMFCRISVPENVALQFKTVALNVKMAISPFVHGPYFVETARQKA